jgi:hypothetical protein
VGINQTRAALYTLVVLRAHVRAALLIPFIEEWQRCVAAQGGEVTPSEFIEWTSRYSMRTTYRHLIAFRQAFPELGDSALPSVLMGPLLRRMAEEANARADAEGITA